MCIADWGRGQPADERIGAGFSSREDRNTGDTWPKTNMRQEGHRS